MKNLTRNRAETGTVVYPLAFFNSTFPSLTRTTKQKEHERMSFHVSRVRVRYLPSSQEEWKRQIARCRTSSANVFQRQSTH